MDSGTDRLVCGREEDLVAFLYGELDDAESRTFQSHMNDCSSCSAEVTSFGNIRHSVIAWRNESLTLSSPAMVHNNATAHVRRQSASAALREFFNLSPTWMKAAVGFASILFCIFTALAISGLRKAPAPVVATTSEKAPSAQEINALVERRVEQRVQDELKRLSVTTPAPLPVNRQPASLSAINHRVRRINNSPLPDVRRPLTRVEREQLAADLRLTAETNDIELRLLGDAINQ